MSVPCILTNKNKENIEKILLGKNKMPNTTSTACVPVRVKMRLQAIGLWAFLSIPSIVVTILLFVWTIDGEKVRFFRLCQPLAGLPLK